MCWSLFNSRSPVDEESLLIRDRADPGYWFAGWTATGLLGVVVAAATFVGGKLNHHTATQWVSLGIALGAAASIAIAWVDPCQREQQEEVSEGRAMAVH